MDVISTEDQRMLQDATRRFLEDRAPIATLRQLADSASSFSIDAWREGVAQGWVGLFTPQAHGGLAEAAEGVIDAAILAEELGRVVYAGPFLSNFVVAFALAQAGNQTQQGALLPTLATGDALAAWCFAAPGVKGGTEPGSVKVSRRASGFTLQGVAANVQDAQLAGYLLVSAVDGGAVSQFLVPADTAGISISPLETLDLGRQLSTVTFSAVQLDVESLVGEYGLAAQQFERQLQVALVLLCAETVGVVDRALEFTLDYVQQRYAFGRPIGSFQAIKHRLADHATQLMGAKAAVAHAARAVQHNAADAAIAVSICKSHCGKFGTEIVRDCLHMHGGIGMTWDHDIHFYLRRAVSNEALWGTASVHHERLCRLAAL